MSKFFVKIISNCRQPHFCKIDDELLSTANVFLVCEKKRLNFRVDPRGYDCTDVIADLDNWLLIEFNCSLIYHYSSETVVIVVVLLWLLLLYF